VCTSVCVCVCVCVCTFLNWECFIVVPEGLGDFCQIHTNTHTYICVNSRYSGSGHVVIVLVAWGDAILISGRRTGRNGNGNNWRGRDFFFFWIPLTASRTKGTDIAVTVRGYNVPGRITAPVCSAIHVRDVRGRAASFCLTFVFERGPLNAD
jgi:hypothetical protein